MFPVYLMDIDWQREQEKFGVNKTKFMLECLRDLDTNLKAMGTRLFVLKGNALETIKKFCKEWVFQRNTVCANFTVLVYQVYWHCSTAYQCYVLGVI